MSKSGGTIGGQREDAAGSGSLPGARWEQALYKPSNGVRDPGFEHVSNQK